MAENLKIDVPSGVRAGIISAVLGIVLIIVLNVFDVSQISFIVKPLSYLLAGMLYTRTVLAKAELGYADSAAGGAISGALGGFILLFGGELISALLASSTFPYTTGLGGLSQGNISGELLSVILTGGALGAIGGAWIVLMRTQRID